MSLLPSLKDVVVNALNRANAVTVVNPDDIEIVSVSDGGNFNARDISVTIAGVASKPNYGEYTCVVRRITLSQFFQDSYFGLGQTLSVPPVTTIKDLLIAIGYPQGFEFPDGVINDGPVNWNNGKASVILNSAVGNPYFYGSVSLSLTLMATSALSTILTRNYVVVQGSTIAEETFYKLVETGNNCALPRNIFNFGPPQTTLEAGVTLGSYNSVVRITPIVASGYTGFYDVFFNRVNLNQFDGETVYVPDDASGNFFDIYDKMTLNTGISTLELVDSEINWENSPASTLLAAKPTSYRAYGQAALSLLRYSEDVQEITINYLSNAALTGADFANKVALQIAKAGKLTVNLNVGPNATLTASAITEVPFNFTKMPKYGEVVVKMKNEGKIYGRGSTSGLFTVNQQATDAIKIDPSFNGRIELENIGSIAGGGGGGLTIQVYLSSAWYYAYGGGGQCAGDAITNNGTGNYPGYAGNLSNPGAARGFTVGNIFQESGMGGYPGEPGSVGRSMDMTAVPYVSLEGNDSTSGPRKPGNAISGAIEKLTIITEGSIKPKLVSPLVAFNAYLEQQGYDRYPASAILTTVADKSLPFVVDYTASNNGPRGAVNRPLGTCWGNLTGEGQALGRALVHGYPSMNVALIGYYFGGVALVELGERKTFGFGSAVNRNNITAPAQTVQFGGYPVTRLVYYDRYLDEVMECNPYLMTTPVKWTPPS